MVELSAAASWLVVDTTTVELEGGLRGIDGNRDWTNCGDGSLEIRLAARSDISVSGYLGTNIGWVVLAGSGYGLVWVAGLGIDSALFDVLEGIVHKTSVASLVSETA